MKIPCRENPYISLLALISSFQRDNRDHLLRHLFQRGNSKRTMCRPCRACLNKPPRTPSRLSFKQVVKSHCFPPCCPRRTYFMGVLPSAVLIPIKDTISPCSVSNPRRLNDLGRFHGCHSTSYFPRLRGTL